MEKNTSPANVAGDANPKLLKIVREPQLLTLSRVDVKPREKQSPMNESSLGFYTIIFNPGLTKMSHWILLMP